MTMAVAYPVNIPLCLNDGYSNVDGDHVVKNPLLTSVITLSKLTEYKESLHNCTWLFTPLEMQVFEGWFRHDLVFGAKSFDMSLKVGSGLKKHECYFKGVYESTLKNKMWKVTAVLMSTGKYYDSLAEYNSSKNSLVLNSKAVIGELSETLNIVTPPSTTKTVIAILNNKSDRVINVNRLSTDAPNTSDYIIRIIADGVDHYDSGVLSDALEELTPLNIVASSNIDVLVSNLDNSVNLNITVTVGYSDG